MLRIWIDPVIDETVLRAIDATIHIASENGIVLDICCFTQWTRQMGFERSNGEHVLFDFRGKRDFNIVSFSLRNLDLQREFLFIIASRWKNAGNIMYNLTNETYVKDPDHTQMDKEAVEWKDIPANNSVLRDSLLFRRWGNEMKASIRKAGEINLYFLVTCFLLTEAAMYMQQMQMHQWYHGIVTPQLNKPA